MPTYILTVQVHIPETMIPENWTSPLYLRSATPAERLEITARAGYMEIRLDGKTQYLTPEAAIVTTVQEATQ